MRQQSTPDNCLSAVGDAVSQDVLDTVFVAPGDRQYQLEQIVQDQALREVLNELMGREVTFHADPGTVFHFRVTTDPIPEHPVEVYLTWLTTAIRRALASKFRKSEIAILTPMWEEVDHDTLPPSDCDYHWWERQSRLHSRLDIVDLTLGSPAPTLRVWHLGVCTSSWSFDSHSVHARLLGLL